MDAGREVMRIVLKGGFDDGDRDHEVPANTVIYRRGLVSDQSCYRRTDVVDPEGHRVFEHFPLPAGESDPVTGVYDWPVDYVAQQSEASGPAATAAPDTVDSKGPEHA